MTEPNQGTPAQPEQANTGIPALEQVLNAQNPVAPVEPTAPPQPSIEDLQAQLNQERQNREQWENQYKALQPEYTRARQALANLAGAPPPQAAQDPLEPYVNELVSQGYSKESARAVASTSYKMTQAAIAPLQQQTQMAQQAANIDYSIQQAAQQWPQLFTSQQEYNEARQAAQYIVQNGGVPDPRTIAAVVNDNRFFRQPNGTPPAAMQPAPPVAQPFANGMYQTRPGFTQPSYQNTSQQLSADQQTAEAFILNRIKPK